MQSFRMLDVVAILIYLTGIMSIGIYFARKNKSTEEYFLGNRSFPGWAVGLSMLGTTVSSVTFLALPAAAYVLDYRNIIPNLTVPIAVVLAIVFFVPFFRKQKITSAFEYLENRYGTHWVRLYASTSYIFLQLARLSTVLYLVSIPVSYLTGINIFAVIVFTGIFIILYTVLGGIEAVIWSEVAQTIVLLLGGIICFLCIVFQMPGGLSQIISIGIEHNKFSLGAFEFDLTQRTFFTMLIIGMIGFITEYSSSQVVIQRYLAAKSTHEARKAVCVCGLMSIPTWLLFFFLGTCLFGFYLVFPDSRISSLEADAIMPHFILTQIPAGVAGIIIAGCLAAAMSTLDSSINAVATLLTVDFLKRYRRKEHSDHYYLKWAKFFSVAAGGIMIGGAVFFRFLPKECMVDLGLIVASLFGGCIFGIFMLGFFVKRVNGWSLIVGIIMAMLANIYFMLDEFKWIPDSVCMNIHSYWIVVLVNLILVFVSITVSFLPQKVSINTNKGKIS